MTSGRNRRFCYLVQKGLDCQNCKRVGTLPWQIGDGMNTDLVEFTCRACKPVLVVSSNNIINLKMCKSIKSPLIPTTIPASTCRL